MLFSRTMRRHRVFACMILVAVTLVATACSAPYSRDPYRNDRVIDPDLVESQDRFAAALQKDQRSAILLLWTVDGWTPQMRRFLDRYAGHPARIVRRSNGDDATAQTLVEVTCSAGDVQQVELTWAWFDEDWRSWPDYDRSEDGKAIEYPGCRS